MYIGAFIINAVIFGTVIIAPISAAIPTADGMVEALAQTPFDAAIILPSNVRELSQSPSLLDICVKKLKVLFSGGGDLPQDVGNVVASRIKLANQYGSSEAGLLSLMLPTDDSRRSYEDWKYLQFHEGLGCDFRQHKGDEFELYIKRDSTSKYQPVFGMFPDALEYRTRDLFLRHPSKKDMWKWCARADDIIVLLTGEKTNPTSMEQHIMSENPNVLGVLVAGAQRFQTALLIHPVQELLTLSDKAAFIENIWPSIEEANQECPAHAKITKSHILFTTPSKPMLFSGKGTIQRAPTLKLYASELDQLYEDADEMSGEIARNIAPIDLRIENLESISKYIRETISSITKLQDLEDPNDFFVLGMDSLQTMMAVRQFRQDLSLPSFSTSTIYANSSVSALSNAIIKLSSAQGTLKMSEAESRERTRKEIVKECQDLIDQISIHGRIKSRSKDKWVVLTGSTGALGSYILHALLEDPTVSHIYCLNRGADSQARQIKRNQTSGLPTKLSTSRVTYLSSDLSKPLLGLQSSIYDKLQHTTTHVIHNAWPVNFKLSIQAFRPQFAGLVNLIEFVATSKLNIELMFISSIGSILDASPTGYTESKQIAEIILTYASKRLSDVDPSATVPFSIVRVGQIAGAVEYKGQWNTAEWFPSLVISSALLNKIPYSLGTTLEKIDWVPIDKLANILIELAFSEEHNDKIPIYHPLNPRTTTYEALLPTIISAVTQRIEVHKGLRRIPPAEWMEHVREDMETKAGPNSDMSEGDLEIVLRKNPAAKLLDFYAVMTKKDGNVIKSEHVEEVEYGKKKTLERSKILRELDAIKQEWVDKWVGEWTSTMICEGDN